MRIKPKSRVGRAFTLKEHQEIFDWNSLSEYHSGWPRVELALNYSDTPEMLGVVECGEVGPTMLVWAAAWGVAVEPLSGGSFTFPSLAAALGELSQWAGRVLVGDRKRFGGD
jgi:hypothetical protein